MGSNQSAPPPISLADRRLSVLSRTDLDIGGDAATKPPVNFMAVINMTGQSDSIDDEPGQDNLAYGDPEAPLPPQPLQKTKNTQNPFEHLDDASLYVEESVHDYPIVLFMRDGCTNSNRVTCLLQAYRPRVMQKINVDKSFINESSLILALRELSGSDKIPQLFIGGVFVGTTSMVYKLDATGQLQDMLIRENAIETKPYTILSKAHSVDNGPGGELGTVAPRFTKSEPPKYSKGSQATAGKIIGARVRAVKTW